MGINMVMDMDISMGMVTWLKHVEKRTDFFCKLI